MGRSAGGIFKFVSFSLGVAFAIAINGGAKFMKKGFLYERVFNIH